MCEGCVWVDEGCVRGGCRVRGVGVCEGCVRGVCGWMRGV